MTDKEHIAGMAVHSIAVAVADLSELAGDDESNALLRADIRQIENTNARLTQIVQRLRQPVIVKEAAE